MSKLKKEDESGTAVLEHTTSKEESKALLNRFIEEETKTVKGKFRNLETPGGSARVQVRKYPGVPMFDKVMEDGRMYEVPLYVARHLNGTDVTATKAGCKIHTCSYPTHGFKFDNSGKIPGSVDGDGGIPVPIVFPAKWTRRFAFESLEFDTGE